MVASAAEKVDPAHWVQMVGGAMMLTVCMACATGLWLPWWTSSTITPGLKQEVYVGLWTRQTTVELAADDSTLNCEAQCDSNRLGSGKVRETSVHWGDICTDAVGDMGTKCMRLWIVRVFVLVCWFSSLIFVAFSFLNFCGAGEPSSVRIPPSVKIGLGLLCLLCNILSLVVANLMDIRVQATPPGTEPALTDNPSIDRVPLNGFGFLGQIASTVLNIFAQAISYLAQYVVNHLEDLADLEQGRELADVNKGPCPDLEHQVQAAWHHHLEEDAVREWQPEAVKLGTWMSN